MRLLDDGQILRIDQLRNEDSGVYTCDVENILHRISASTDLRVRDPSQCFVSARYLSSFLLQFPRSSREACRT